MLEAVLSAPGVVLFVCAIVIAIFALRLGRQYWFARKRHSQQQQEAMRRQRELDQQRAEEERTANEKAEVEHEQKLAQEKEAKKRKKAERQRAYRKKAAAERKRIAQEIEEARIAKEAEDAERLRQFRIWKEKKQKRAEAHADNHRKAAQRRRDRTSAAREALSRQRDAWDQLDSQTEYISQSWVDTWWFQSAANLVPDPRLRWRLPTIEGQELVRRIVDIEKLSDRVADLNGRFVERRIAEEADRFDTIEAYPLESQQRRAIVTNEDTTLVVAGAGTGKTSTIIGRVDYLVRRGLASPEQVLVLAYNKSAAEELRVRMDRLGVSTDVEIRTFHALGLSIVGEATGKRPRLSKLVNDERARLSLIRDVIAGMLANPAGRELLIAFLAKHLDEDDKKVVEGDGSSSADRRIRAEQARGLHAINGEKLRSREEVQIANWLTLNGIEWVYERPYPESDATPWKRVYLPDFYLPDHDIYLEHFGIDRQGNTAPQVNQKRYNEAIDWKRDLHQKSGTTLVETYSWMRMEGILLEALEDKLRSHNVAPRPLSEEQIAEVVKEANRPFSEFLVLIDTFRALFQGSGANREAVEARAKSKRDRAFLAIFWAVYERYRNELQRTATIDFDDMINAARDYILSGQYNSRFTHIVVDEFQDISENRLGLLQDLRAHQAGSRLFVVGDDWQSIYRFAGSDVGIITGLPERVGTVARVDLDVAFRYSQELLDLSSAFVMKNPAQLKKQLRAARGNLGEQPVSLVYDPPPTEDGPIPALETIADELIVQNEKRDRSVLVLGRYRQDDDSSVQDFMRQLRRSSFSPRFSTVHSAKGQEADIVVVVGLKSGRKGFPSEVADDPVLHLVLSPGEAFRHSEERRLFYVALTRAKDRVYLISPQDEPSPFLIEDLLTGEFEEFVKISGTPRRRMVCPQCGGKTIVRKESDSGIFWACEHFPVCRGRLDQCSDCEAGVLELRGDANGMQFVCTGCHLQKECCPRCKQGYLAKKDGKFGAFLGCSMFARAGCEYTRDPSVMTYQTVDHDRSAVFNRESDLPSYDRSRKPLLSGYGTMRTRPRPTGHVGDGYRYGSQVDRRDVGGRQRSPFHLPPSFGRAEQMDASIDSTSMIPQWPEWELVAPTSREIIIGNPVWGQLIEMHEKCYLGSLRVDLCIVHESPEPGNGSRAAIVLFSRRENSLLYTEASVWRAISHVRRPWVSPSDRDLEVTTLKEEVRQLIPEALKGISETSNEATSSNRAIPARHSGYRRPMSVPPPRRER